MSEIAMQQSLYEAQIETEKQRLAVIDLERKNSALSEENYKLRGNLIEFQSLMDRRLEDIRVALKSVGWTHDSVAGLWSHEWVSDVDFETAVVYAIRFRSSAPPNVSDRVKVASGAFVGFEGTVDAIDLDKNCITVIVDIFGRTTPVQLQVQELIILSSDK